MAGTDGTANTGGGGGGGGGYWNFQPGGTGGSGVVIVRYPHNGTIPSTFSWNTNGSAGWSGGVNWTNNLGGTDVWSPGIGGQTNYTLNFNQAGIYTATNDLRSGFLLNQLNFGGPTLTLSGNSLEFTGTLPQINQNSSATITVGNNLILDANTTFGGSGAGTVTLNGAISGAGSLTKVGPGKLVLTGNNTYSGATTLSSGTLKLDNMMAIVTPTAATAESYYVPGDRAPGHTIDGSGMTPSSPVTVAGYNGAAPTSICDNSANSTTWLSNGNTPSWITFDLGSNQTIIGFHLWNYNENSGNPSLYTERGVNSASIYTETSLMGGSGVGTLVQNMTFAQATGATSYTGADYTFGSPVTARYIEIYANTNFGGDNYTGLSEIRFFTSASSGTLPTGTALSIAAGATFDVSVYANYILGAGALLTASGTGAMVGSNAAVITGAARGTVSLGARPILLIWSGAAAGTDGAHPALVISQGNLSLNGNTFTVVVAGTALSNGVYTLITTPSAISGTVNPTPSFAGGHGLDGGRAGVVSINGNNVILTIDSATPPTLGAPQALGGNLILTGTGGTANAGYTWLTATNLSAPIKWITNSTGTLDGTGAFSNAIPVPATPPANFFKLRLP
jgi:autotransporter-associated beta strand protein